MKKLHLAALPLALSLAACQITFNGPATPGEPTSPGGTQLANWALFADGVEICSGQSDVAIECADLVFDQVTQVELVTTNQTGVNTRINIASPYWPLLSHSGLHQAKPSFDHAKWKNSAQAALAMQHDDLCGSTTSIADSIVNELSQRQLTASFGVIAGNCNDQDWQNMQAWLAQGFEIFNHTLTHENADLPSWDTTGVLNWNSDVQISQANELVQQKTGYAPSMFAFPSDLATTETLDYLKAHGQIKMARGGNFVDGTWVNTGKFNTADFRDPYQLSSELYSEWGTYWGQGELARLTAYVDETLLNGGFALQYFHGVADASYFPVPVSEYRQYLDFLVRARDTQGLWVDSAEEIVNYRFSREFCELKPAESIPFGWYLQPKADSPVCQDYLTEVTGQLAMAQPVAMVLQQGQPLVFEQQEGVIEFNYLPSGGDLVVIAKP